MSKSALWNFFDVPCTLLAPEFTLTCPFSLLENWTQTHAYLHKYNALYLNNSHSCMPSHRYWYFYVSLCLFMLYDQCSMYFGIEILSPCTRIFLSPCFLWFILFMYSYYTYMSFPYYHFSLFSARLLITSEKGVRKKRIYRYAVYFSREL